MRVCSMLTSGRYMNTYPQECIEKAPSANSAYMGCGWKFGFAVNIFITSIMCIKRSWAQHMNIDVC